MSIEQEIYNKLVEQFGVGEICVKKWDKRKQLTWLEFITAVLNLEVSELHGFCGFSTGDGLNKYFNREFKEVILLKGHKIWRTFLLNLIACKKCAKCNKVKKLIEFNAANINNVGYTCYECKHNYYLLNREKILNSRKVYYTHNKEKISDREKEYRNNNKSNYIAYEAKRRAAKLNATPKWADLEAIKEIYKSCPEGYHVDHEIPLQGKLVCGLHVHTNLQHLPAAENISKSNKYTIV